MLVFYFNDFTFVVDMSDVAIFCFNLFFYYYYKRKNYVYISAPVECKCFECSELFHLRCVRVSGVGFDVTLLWRGTGMSRGV